jgi:hypothetical protein
MSKKTINVGSSPNAGNGDPLRIAFGKINDNFNELYTLTGGTTSQLIEIAQDYAAAMVTNGEHSGVTVNYDDQSNKLNFTVNIDGGNASTSF